MTRKCTTRTVTTTTQTSRTTTTTKTATTTVTSTTNTIVQALLKEHLSSATALIEEQVQVAMRDLKAIKAQMAKMKEDNNAAITTLQTENGAKVALLQESNQRLQDSNADLRGRIDTLEARFQLDGSSGAGNAQLAHECAAFGAGSDAETDAGCPPSVSSNGSHLKLDACCGSITFNSKTCTVDPCQTQLELRKVTEWLGM